MRSEGRLSHHSSPTHLACLCGKQCLPPVAQHFLRRENIITPEALKYAPQGVREILLLVKDNTSTIYVRKPLPSGKDRIQKLQHNLRQPHLSLISSTFYSLRTQLSIGIVIFLSKASTPPTLPEREITSSRPKVSPPLKTLHTISPYLPCTTSLSCLWILF